MRDRRRPVSLVTSDSGIRRTPCASGVALETSIACPRQAEHAGCVWMPLVEGNCGDGGPTRRPKISRYFRGTFPVSDACLYFVAIVWNGVVIRAFPFGAFDSIFLLLRSPPADQCVNFLALWRISKPRNA